MDNIIREATNQKAMIEKLETQFKKEEAAVLQKYNATTSQDAVKVASETMHKRALTLPAGEAVPKEVITEPQHASTRADQARILQEAATTAAALNAIRSTPGAA